MAELLPAIFFGHGTPMNALSNNIYTEAWRRIGREIGKPKAILAISAHWFIPGTGVTIATAPRTIHDFGGFPKELYAVEYAAPGDPNLARRVAQLLAPLPVHMDEGWGLDHGTWSVLRHVYPEADVPVVQLSIDRSMAAPFHFEIGRRLAPLREEGILILGSGNLVHNLRAYRWDAQETAEPYDWAVHFETQAKQMLMAEDDVSLIGYEKLGREAILSIPTPDHYLPLLYVIGTRQRGEPIHFPVTGIEGGSISMLTVEVGGSASQPRD
ncbi:MAG: 4,5-DOPA dioxygenase extradiol [Bryobacteraceae bacterium]